MAGSARRRRWGGRHHFVSEEPSIAVRLSFVVFKEHRKGLAVEDRLGHRPIIAAQDPFEHQRIGLRDLDG